MGWIISVGKAGGTRETKGVQAVSVCVHMNGQRTLITVGGHDTDRMQAQRVWQTVLTTLIGDRH